MKIVVLDGYAANPGDLSWDKLSNLGELTVYERTKIEETAQRLEGVEIALTNKSILSAEVLKNLPDLKYIGVLATGYNIVDVKAANALGITVTNVPTYSTDSVAQLTFSLLLELMLHVQRHSDSALSGKWASSRDYSYWEFPLIELSGKTLGIVGFGRIGSRVADIAQAFGMNVIAYARHPSDQSERRAFKWVELDQLYREADVISLHCSLNESNQNMIDHKALSRMKKTAFLINTSRGGLINEADLAAALDQELIAGAAVDVLSVEPPSADNPLLSARNILVTPHIAWATFEARKRLLEVAADNLAAYLNGTPQNMIR